MDKRKKSVRATLRVDMFGHYLVRFKMEGLLNLKTLKGRSCFPIFVCFCMSEPLIRCVGLHIHAVYFKTGNLGEVYCASRGTR